jgi:sulfatase maturation enzyme AslB (radical SAM superfamily)
MKPEKTNTFCYYPFKSLAIKSFNKDKLESAWPCCMMGDTLKPNIMNMGDISDLTPEEIFDHPRFEQLRNNALNGVRDPACETCWRQEDDGLTSFRFFSNDEIYTDSSKELNTIDITTSNICNLRCRMCTPSNSNSLMIDYRYFEKNDLLRKSQKVTGLFFKSPIVKNVTESIQWDWLMENTTKIKVLKASGGEPFYDNKIIELLLKYIETGAAKDTTLTFHTNATVFNQDLFEILAHFKDNTHVFSVDGTEKIYDYIRYPATFDLLNKNIEMYKNANISKLLRFNMVVSAYNVLDIPEYIKWILNIDSQSNIHFSEIYPLTRGVGLRRLPPRLLTLAKSQLIPFTESTVPCNENVKKLIGIIDNAINKNRENYKLMRQEIKLFDKSRNQCYSDYLNRHLIEYLK